MKPILLLIFLAIAFNSCLAKGNTVVVVGAGPSGIAAASKLHDLNVDVIVLEAEPRIGGRVNSVYFGNAFIDLGAEWCHGQEGNIVYELVKNYSILGPSKFPKMLYTSDRKPVDDVFSIELHDIFENIFHEDNNRKQQDGISVGEYFIKKYNSTIRERYAHDENKMSFAFEAMECFQHYTLSAEGAFSWFDTSTLNDYSQCPGNQNLHWSGHGYRTILQVLMKTYPTVDPSFKLENKIIINQEVKRISWGQRGVTITCSDGSEHNADHVIFTPSLGVLKNKHKSLFSPQLPISKTKAIRDLGISAVMKIMMHFPTRWWPATNFSGFSLVWNYHDRDMILVEFPHGPSSNGRSWLLDMFGVYLVENNPNVLSVWFTGKLVPEIEKIPDQLAIDGIMFAFNKFFGHMYTLVNPDKILRTYWYTNPHFRGTYSYQTLASRKMKPSANSILSEPLLDTNLVPRVLFAGEATNPTHYSTVHGAIETGFREANRIVAYLENKKQTQQRK